MGDWQSSTVGIFRTLKFAATGERPERQYLSQKQQHHFLGLAVAQHFCHGDPGKKMSARRSSSAWGAITSIQKI